MVQDCRHQQQQVQQCLPIRLLGMRSVRPSFRDPPQHGGEVRVSLQHKEQTPALPRLRAAAGQPLVGTGVAPFPASSFQSLHKRQVQGSLWWHPFKLQATTGWPLTALVCAPSCPAEMLAVSPRSACCCCIYQPAAGSSARAAARLPGRFRAWLLRLLTACRQQQASHGALARLHHAILVPQSSGLLQWARPRSRQPQLQVHDGVCAPCTSTSCPDIALEGTHAAARDSWASVGLR